MNRSFKLLLVFFILIGVIGTASAMPFVNPITSAVKKADISKNALISVSFKELSNGKNSYEYNSSMPMTPASVQKIVTLLPSVDTLGTDYEFKTQLYKDKNNYLYLKLGADPYLTTADLKDLIRGLAKYKIYSIKEFYIDDTIVDRNEWGEGWQWDDDLNPLIPKFGAYNLDKNLLTINFCPTQIGAPVDISTDVFYPTAFMNNIITANQTDIKLDRKNYISPDVINANGTVSYETSLQIPINYPRRYFILRLEDVLRKQKVAYYGDFNTKKLPQNTFIVAEEKHSIQKAINDILQKSDNMVAETVFKVAGGAYAKKTGTNADSLNMLNAYYKKQGIDTTNIKVVDGSGVSKNNLLTSDFITDVLVKASKSKGFDLKAAMASPGEGTLKDRMLYFKDNLKAKTGTLTNTSTIAGYLTTKSGKNYAFCIMINDPRSKSSDKKSFEEYVLREAFEKL